jgi:putative ABC transport system permease protein
MPEPEIKSSRSKISRQIVLPWKKSLEMAFSSLRLRFFRSLITVFSLLLAIAFLSFTLTNTAIARELYRMHGQIALPLLTLAGYVFDPALAVINAGPKELWLMILSLLVCTVGIVNAQLMSVTERFREIGIMKCLGALDRIILRLFLMEAVILGVLGAGAGSILGLFAAWGGAMLQYQSLNCTGISLAPLLTQASHAWGIGIGLSILGVLYPAILAAKLQPVIVMKEEY